MFYFCLDKTLDELGITRNKLAVESKVRPNTISDLVKGDITRIDFYSLQAILDTLNFIAEKKKIPRKYDINDIVKYNFKGEGKYYFKNGDTE